MRGMTVLSGTVLGALVLCLGAGDVAAGERLVLYTELVVCGAALFISLKGRAARNASALVMTVIMAAGCFRNERRSGHRGFCGGTQSCTDCPDGGANLRGG